MDGPSTPKNPRIISIQHESDVGRTPSYSTSHYTSSTKITDAKANLKIILANRVSFNDRNIVDALIKPAKVSDPLVKALRDHIMDNAVIKDFRAQLRHKEIDLEREMYEPLVRGNYRLCFECSCLE